MQGPTTPPSAITLAIAVAIGTAVVEAVPQRATAAAPRKDDLERPPR